jgi:hypothetical protein
MLFNNSALAHVRESLAPLSKLGKLIKLFSHKATRLCLVASALGLTVVGLLRYNATASDSLTLSAAKALFFGEKAKDELYAFSMEQVGTQSSYTVFKVSVVKQGVEAKAFLQVQKANHDVAVRQYEKNLDPESFAKFWQALRELEAAQLTNLSPYTENLDPLSESSTTRVPASMTYRFIFQDGVHDYPNSFEVYAPDSLKDTRYRQLRDVTAYFAQETFGQSVFE